MRSEKSFRTQRIVGRMNWYLNGQKMSDISFPDFMFKTERIHDKTREKKQTKNHEKGSSSKTSES